jgi:hypothetical protein
MMTGLEDLTTVAALRLVELPDGGPVSFETGPIVASRPPPLAAASPRCSRITTA